MKEELLKCALAAAEKAGAILIEGFGASFKIGSKSSRNDLVTEYDIKSEKAIIEHIKNIYPDHEFLAEESGATGEKNVGKVRWIIDPLDGTVNFAHSLPIFSVSIAAEVDGELVCGVVFHPILDEMFSAVKGGGAFLNGEPIKASACDDFRGSFLVTGFPYNVFDNPCNCVDAFAKVVGMGIPVRRLGSAALDLAYVAMGRFDGFWEIDLKPWDVAAGILLVREAGGNVTTYYGDTFDFTQRTMLATNGLIHSQAMDLISSCSTEVK